MSKTNLAIYYPIIYKGVLETDKLVATENVMFDELDSLTSEAEENQFILTSNAGGLQIYEKILNIIANPESDSIQFRRERIINRLSTAPPFTIKELRNKLDQLLGQDNYIIDLVHREYKFNLTSYIGEYGKLDEMLRTLFVMIPVNLEKHILNLIIQTKETSLYRGQAISASMVYTLSSDINSNYSVQANEAVGQAISASMVYTLSSDINSNYSVQANEAVGQVVDLGKDYLLSSDIVNSATVQVENKTASVVSPGMTYNIN